MRSKSYRVNINPIPWKAAERKPSRSYEGVGGDIVAFGLHIAQQHNEEPLFTNPIAIKIKFYMPFSTISHKPRPKGINHVSSPFLDNLYKFIIHTLKDVVIADERIICSLSLQKVYDKEPRTEIVITELE